MRRFRLYWGDHNIRTRDSIVELLNWVERCLYDTHANIFDGEECICTARVADYGVVTYVVNGDHITRNDVIRMGADAIVEDSTMVYKLGDRVCTVNECSRIDGELVVKSMANGVIGAIKADEYGDTYYRIDWDEGGHDYLYPCELEVLTTYRVCFTDVRDGCPNQKILESNNIQDIYDYMAYLGHTNVEVEPINKEE